MADIAAKLLENNIDRVVESVMRTINSARVADLPSAAVPLADAPERQEDEIRDQIIDLCGHVAVALRGLHLPHGDVASYAKPAAPPAGPVVHLDVRR